MPLLENRGSRATIVANNGRKSTSSTTLTLAIVLARLKHWPQNWMKGMPCYPICRTSNFMSKIEVVVLQSFVATRRNCLLHHWYNRDGTCSTQAPALSLVEHHFALLKMLNVQFHAEIRGLCAIIAVGDGQQSNLLQASKVAIVLR
jgi:hypothetical protein